jgi:hypothetical protein
MTSSLPGGAQAAARSPETVLRDHLDRRRRGDLEGDLAANYAEQVAVLSKDGVFHGKDGVRRAASILESRLPGATYSNDLVQAEGEVAMLNWSAKAEGGARTYEGADSFVIRDGLIVAQTIHYSVGSVAPSATGGELLEDGQEEVFSRTAVEHGVVADPLALGPVESGLGQP